MPIMCGKCGSTNPDAAQFCAGCGTLLEWHGTSVPEPGPTAVPPARPQRPRAEQTHELMLSLNPTEPQTVSPGQRVTLLVTVRNVGSIVEEVIPRISGLPADWCQFDPPRLTLMPGTETKTALTVSPPRSSSARAGTYVIAIDAVSGIDPDVRAHGEATLAVGPFLDLTAELLPENSSGRLRGRHTLTIRNSSNVPVRAEMAASDKDRQLRFLPPVTPISLVPEATTTVSFTVRPTRIRWFGHPQPRRFATNVVAQDSPSVVTPGNFTQLAVLPRWVIPVAAIAAVGIVALATLGHHKHPAGIAIRNSSRTSALTTKAHTAPVHPILSTTATTLRARPTSSQGDTSGGGQPGGEGGGSITAPTAGGVSAASVTFQSIDGPTKSFDATAIGTGPTGIVWVAGVAYPDAPGGPGVPGVWSTSVPNPIPTDWQKVPYAVATGVAGGPDGPWAVNSAGEIFYTNVNPNPADSYFFAAAPPTSPFDAVSIGVDPDGEAWVGSGGGGVWSTPGTDPNQTSWTQVPTQSQTQSQTPLVLKDIAGGPDGQWAVTSTGQIVYDPISGGAGFAAAAQPTIPFMATAIGAGGNTADVQVWVTDGTSLYLGSPSTSAPNTIKWTTEPESSVGTITALAVDSNGDPWVVNASGQMFRGAET
jgi:hypothetical protein